MKAPDEVPGIEYFNFDPNTATVEEFTRLGLSEKVANTIANYRNKGGVFRKPEDFRKIWSLQAADFERLLPYIRIGAEEPGAAPRPVADRAPELFQFDPNAAGEDDFLRLGLPPRTVKSILNYRAKGGVFRNREDFRKIYTLDAKDYTRLEQWMVFTQLTTTAAAAAPNAAAKTRQPLLIDINLADAETWQRLPGIGEKRARQIVKYRSTLGGFLSVEQLGEMYGLPDSVFRNIRPALTLQDGNIRRINLNTAAEEELDRHPYISSKQAKLIVAYRTQHGAYPTVDDLGRIAAFSDKKWLEKIRPYLTTE
jgi:competence ComEA-like helix-hairpin-helix protein